MTESPGDLLLERILGRDRQDQNSSVDPLDWLTFVFPRFADLYQEAQTESLLSKNQLKPKLEIFCLINVPKIVGLKLTALDELICLSLRMEMESAAGTGT